MIYTILSGAVAFVHLLFLLFVGLGGLLVLRWAWVAWGHLPAVLWGAAISFFGWPCPLTPLENYFRRRAGEAGYEGGFIENYLLPLIYVEALTRPLQIGLGVAVVLVNGAVYAGVWRKWRKRSRSSPRRK